MTGEKEEEGENLQDGREVRHGDQLPPHKYIRNTSTCGKTSTEHLLTLAEDFRPPKRQENPQVPG